MINLEDFEKIRKRLNDYDRQREDLIKKSRDVLKLSKQLIYSVHRKDMKEAQSLFLNLKKEKSALDAIVGKNVNLESEGSYSEACQEFVEAVSYLSFIKTGKILSVKETGTSDEDYLMGICDLTGELARKAVMVANKDPDEVVKIKECVEEIFGEFLKLDLRNGNLRKKSDSIKWNLKKLEEIMYDIKK